MCKAWVNRIIPFSNVDGPGNRTAVFFQGCTFDCLFCHNPETIRLCDGCGACVGGCPAGALERDGAGRVTWDRERCVGCDACIRACPRDASPRVTLMGTDDVMREIRRAAPYTCGVTVSGGECTLHRGFLIALFREAHAIGKTCLMDSNGSFDFSGDPDLLAACDGVMLDVKAADRAWSERLTGDPGYLVLKNLDFLLESGKLFEVRTVIFPGRDRENEETVRRVAGRVGNACPYKLIRYRPYGVRERYRDLMGREETDPAYAGRFAGLARDLGATGAYVV